MRRLSRNEDGTILVFVAIALAVLLGMVALSFDLGRMAATQTELQSFADSVALAASGELDGSEGAIGRAQNAATDLIQDQQTFGNGGHLLDAEDMTLTFLSALPTNDRDTDAAAAIVCSGTDCAGADANDDAAAIFVRVDIDAHSIEIGFASALSVLRGGTEKQASVAATATAGFTQYACNITPMMFFLPSATYDADEHIGDMVIMRSGGNGAAWGPGDFGFLDPTAHPVDPAGRCGASKLSGRNLYSCLTGADGPLTQCIATRGGVTTEPGQRSGVAEASFNVRYDIYRATMSGEKSIAAYAPAPNVLKGVMPNGGGSCIGGNQNLTQNTSSLTRDTCFATSTCPYPRFGDGTWNRDGYIRLNYNNIDPAIAAAANPLAVREPALAGTRYQMYLDEITNAGGVSARTPIVPARDPALATQVPPLPTDRWQVKANGSINVLTETGRPMCSADQSTDPDRRVIIVAGINCDNSNGGTEIKGCTVGVPVQEFFRVFLTEPVRDDGLSPPNVDITGEIIGSAGSGAGSTDDGVFHDVVQPYR
jgi:hypothetical protein